MDADGYIFSALVLGYKITVVLGIVILITIVAYYLTLDACEDIQIICEYIWLLRGTSLYQVTTFGGGSTQQPPRRGRGSSVSSELPKFVYRPSDGNLSYGEVCSICIETVEEEAIITILPNCKHMFHAACIDIWLDYSRTTCPICRTEVLPLRPAKHGGSSPRVQPRPPIIHESVP